MMRQGMSCSDCGLTDAGMQADSANDDAAPDVWSAADLMGMLAWALYCERWNPMRWWPKALRRRSA